MRSRRTRGRRALPDEGGQGLWPPPDTLRLLQASAEAGARRLGLRLRAHTWRGRSGNWAGAGRGASLDFQDHRPYLPGDDPRHINWQAYARTGVFSMKLYREEVSPLVDVVLDVSRSMLQDAPKRERALELAFFAVASARALGASLRLFAVAGDRAAPVPRDDLTADGVLPEGSGAGGLSLAGIAFRPGSLRVLVSDCLVPGPPTPLLRTLGAHRGRAVVFAVGTRAESDPDWEGHVELVDCETEERRLQRVDAALRSRYRDAYRRHFELWRAEARRGGAAFARVPGEGALLEALQREALPEGAVEPSW